MSLSVLVAIEMFNAFNALSEDNSLLQLPPWSNPWLLLATCISLGLHCVILYIPFLAQVNMWCCGPGHGRVHLHLWVPTFASGSLQSFQQLQLAEMVQHRFISFEEHVP